VALDTVEGASAAIDENEGILFLNTEVELRIDEGEDEAVTKLTTEVEWLDEDSAVLELATEVEFGTDEDEEVTTKVEFKMDVELDLKFRSAA
jgi:hypothetical protein